MSNTVICTSVPVDGAWHRLDLGRIVHVDCRRADVVEVWSLPKPGPRREYRAFATGQEAPASAKYVGTALMPTPAGHAGQVVRHLFERRSP